MVIFQLAMLVLKEIWKQIRSENVFEAGTKYMATNLHGNGTYPKYHPCMKWYIYPYMNRWILNGKCMYVDLYQPSMDGMGIASAKNNTNQPGKNHIPCSVRFVCWGLYTWKVHLIWVHYISYPQSPSGRINLIPFTSKSASFFGKKEQRVNAAKLGYAICYDTVGNLENIG